MNSVGAMGKRVGDPASIVVQSPAASVSKSRCLPRDDSSPDCRLPFMSKSLAHRLAEYACSLNLRRSLAGSRARGEAAGDRFVWLRAGRMARRAVRDRAQSRLGFSAKNGGTIIGTDHQAPPDWAAFATGCCIRYFDYNDTYLSKEPAHPSDNIAAALAVARASARMAAN